MLATCSAGRARGASQVEPFGIEAVVDRLLQELAKLVPSAHGAIVGTLDMSYGIRIVRANGTLRCLAGAPLSLNGSLSGLAVRSQRAHVCDDASGDDRVDRATAAKTKVSSLVCVPLARDGTSFGVLAVAAHQPRAFCALDVAVCKVLAEALSAVASAGIGTSRPAVLDGPGWGGGPAPKSPCAGSRFPTWAFAEGHPRLAGAKQRVKRALARGRLTMEFQPIVELATMSVVAFEAFARFSGGPEATPESWFAAAHLVGLGTELELLALRSALDALELLPPGVALAVNLGPSAICSPKALAVLQQAGAGRVVVELTEHEPVQDYAALVQAAAALREAGCQLAVDDTGAGFSSLAHIAKLRPDLIKLDKWIVRGLGSDETKRALATALLYVARSLHAKVVAEGVETAEDLLAARELGLELAQGYYLGRPSPLPGACTEACVRRHG